MNIKDYYSTKQPILAANTEKKVEIWHFLLRDSIERHYTAEQIRLNAKLLKVNKTQQEFRKHFVPEYLRGTGEKDQTPPCRVISRISYQQVATNCQKSS